MERIEIPGIERFARMQHRAQVAMGYRKPEDDDDERERHPVLAGLATSYLQPHIFDGRIEMFARGVFAPSLASGKRVNLQLDHDDAIVVANSNNGLALKEADIGLMFYLDLRRAKNASAIHGVVDSGNRACASVAYTVEDEHYETYAGHKVRVIDRASLKEVTLCRKGVVQQAFAFLSDNVVNPSIDDLHNSTMFALSRCTHNVRRANAAILDNTAQLTARIDRLCEKAGIRST